MAGLLGIKLADAQKSLDLFTWFCFAQVEEAPATAGAAIFRPDGPAFKRLVKLELTVAPDDTITAASLHLLRAFIDGNAAQAGDVAKSFVRYADGPDIARLSEEIMTRGLRGSSQPVLVRGNLPTVTATPSAAYEVFAGQAKRVTVGNLTLENRGPELVLSLNPASEAQGWLARLLHRAR